MIFDKLLPDYQDEDSLVLRDADGENNLRANEKYLDCELNEEPMLTHECDDDEDMIF